MTAALRKVIQGPPLERELPEKLAQAHEIVVEILSEERFRARDPFLPKAHENDDLVDAENIYSTWATKHNWYWRAVHYALHAFRLVYTKKLFVERTNQLLIMLEYYFTSAGSDVLSEFFLQRQVAALGSRDIPTIKILSFGCGPGTDAASMLHTLRTVQPGLWSAGRFNVQVTLVDREKGWKGAAEAAVKACSAEGDREPVFIAGSWENADVLHAAKRADILVFSHLLVDAAHWKFGKPELVHNFISNVLNSWEVTPDPRSTDPCYPCPKLLIWADRFPPDRIPVIKTRTKSSRTIYLSNILKDYNRKTCMGVIDVGMPCAPSLAVDQMAEQLEALSLSLSL